MLLYPLLVADSAIGVDWTLLRTSAPRIAPLDDRGAGGVERMP
jgi:hypothetical protein